RRLPAAASPLEEARELGLAPEDLKYSGMVAFQPDSPVQNPEWMLHFASATSTAKLLKYYVRHPGRALELLRSVLVDDARERRSKDLGNLRRELGRPRYLSQRFALWDIARSWMYRRWPWHIVMWYALLIFGIPLRLLRESNGLSRATLWILWSVALAAVAEFCVAALADGLDGGRHLLLFHVFTDCTFLMGLALLSARRGDSRAADDLRVQYVRPAAAFFCILVYQFSIRQVIRLTDLVR